MKVLKIDTKGNIDLLELNDGEGFNSGASRLLCTEDLDVRMITPPRGLIDRSLELYSIDRAYDLNLEDNLLATVIYGTGHIIKGKTAYGCSNYASGCKNTYPFDRFPAYSTPDALAKLIKESINK